MEEKIINVLHKLSLYLTEQNEKLQCHGFVTESMEISFENLIDEINQLCGTQKNATSTKKAKQKRLRRSKLFGSTDKDVEMYPGSSVSSDSEEYVLKDFQSTISDVGDGLEQGEIIHYNNQSNKSKQKRKKRLKPIESRTGERILCDLCNNTYASYSVLKQHIRDKHTDLRPFGCNSCNKAFKRKSHLQEHKLTHIVKSRPLRCTVCFKDFFSNKILQQHIRNSHKDQCKFNCPLCDRYFSKAILMNEHIKHFHKDNLVKNHCDECSITFKTEELLAKHQLTHDNEADFVCSLCLLGFTSEEEFRKHVKDHKEKQHNETVE